MIPLILAVPQVRETKLKQKGRVYKSRRSEAYAHHTAEKDGVVRPLWPMELDQRNFGQEPKNESDSSIIASAT
jgi:hypothetical protein